MSSLLLHGITLDVCKTRSETLRTLHNLKGPSTDMRSTLGYVGMVWAKYPSCRCLDPLRQQGSKNNYISAKDDRPSHPYLPSCLPFCQAFATELAASTLRVEIANGWRIGSQGAPSGRKGSVPKQVLSLKPRSPDCKMHPTF